MPERKIWFDLHEEGIDSPDVAILGLPFDGSSSRERGAAAAPDRLREISRTSDPITRSFEVIDRLTLTDFGDVPAIGPDGQPIRQDEFLKTAGERIAALPKDSFQICLGGDNSVSIPAIRGFARKHGTDVGVIWYDAHPDLFETYQGNPDSHACALRRAIDTAGIDPGRVFLLGTRSFSRTEADYIRGAQVKMITATEWLATSTEAVAARIADAMANLPAVYLAVDIDGFDAAHAPGTGYPMPGGIGSEAFFRLLDLLFPRIPIRALDLTEIAPRLDRNDATSFLGVQVILETVGSIRRQRDASRVKR